MEQTGLGMSILWAMLVDCRPDTQPSLYGNAKLCVLKNRRARILEN